MKPLLKQWRLFASISFISVSTTGLGQSISGYILDENQNPVPFANVFVRELESGTAADDKGKYYLTIDPGIYHVVISSIGYQPQTVQIIIKDKPVIRNFQINSSSVQLGQIEIKVRRRDPAYEIIQKVIDNKEKFLTAVKSYKVNIYLRAGETVDEKKKKESKKETDEELKKEGPPVDPFEEARKKEAARLEKINLTEMQAVLNYQAPDQYKEERTAFKTYGTQAGLFIPVFSQTDFNFYHNLVHLKGIAEVPMISPVSRTAIISYRYRLEEIFKEQDQTIYKIKVTPRKTGDATGHGYLYINDSTWNINRLEFTMHKGGLKFYDDFTIKQTYQKIDDTLWIPTRQEFIYLTKSGGRLFKGSTVLAYSDYQRDYLFPPKFFGNEVAITTKEAYERDSAYWNNARVEPLTADQKKVVAYRDSIEAAHKTKQYLDSMETKYNKVTVGEVLYHGIGFRSEAKKSYINFPPLLSMIDFAVIGGFRLGSYASYFKRFENDRMMSTSTSINMGIKNQDWQGSLNFWTRYNPYRLGDASVHIGRNFQAINSFDAYLNQLKISNFILHEYANFFHRIELFNGFYVSTDVGFSNRRSINDLDRTSILNKVIKEVDPVVFENYQAVITNLKLAYTPGQKFMSEPTRKVVLGSKYPTFSFNHKKGWNGLFGSDIDFDYIDFSIQQNLSLGTLGNSRYTVTAGKFVNTRDLRYVDMKRFRQSDPILMSTPLYSFQSLDTSLIARDWFFEAHYVHSFNGALINNIPLIKKIKLRTVAGAGMMWLKENNYRYEEIFGGVERIFKIGARRRLKIGAYGVLSQSNFLPPKADWKISFDIIDTWRRDWSY